MKIGQVIRDEFDGRKDLSGIGGVESGRDAAEFLLLGANTVQVSHAHCMHVSSPYACQVMLAGLIVLIHAVTTG